MKNAKSTLKSTKKAEKSTEIGLKSGFAIDF